MSRSASCRLQIAFSQRGEAAQQLQSEGLDARFIRLDVTDHNTIDAAAERIGAEFGKLDILVNNAVLGLDRTRPSQLDMDILRRTYDTNVFGVFAVTMAMLPLLKKSEAGRIVNMSSWLRSLTQASDPNGPFASVNLLTYNSSKTAVNALTVQFSTELRGTPIKVNAADPV